MLPLESDQPLFNLFLGKGLMALGTLVLLVNNLVVDEILGKINPMKQERKIVDQLEILISTFVADKKILDRIHLATLHNTCNLLFLFSSGQQG